MRKVKARLLKLNDILDGDKSDSDSSESMKAPQAQISDINNSSVPPSNSQVMLPPMPQTVPPPKPIIMQVPAQVSIAKPKIKK